jgi:PiT family inorganic phosphate transporter
MENLYWMAVATVVIVLFFDYTNGFHDAAKHRRHDHRFAGYDPAQAVVVVGVFEFLGPLLGGTAVANTIGKFVDLSTVDASLAVLILFCGLLGAIVWNLATWWFGIPSSSSHALVGGLAGAVVAAVGSEYVIWGWTPLMHDGKLLA